LTYGDGGTERRRVWGPAMGLIRALTNPKVEM